jgi:hypothetical protein
MTAATEPLGAVQHEQMGKSGKEPRRGPRGENRPASEQLLSCTRNSDQNSSAPEIFSGPETLAEKRAARAGFAAALLVASAIAAHADDAAPAKVPDFVPFVVDAQQDAAARAYLNGLTFKDAAPLVAWLNELEARAKRQWEADNAPKEVPKP